MFKPRPAADVSAGTAPGGGIGLPAGHPQLGGGQPAAPMSTAAQRRKRSPRAEEMRNMEEAVANTERTPELEKGLDELLPRASATSTRAGTRRRATPSSG